MGLPEYCHLLSWAFHSWENYEDLQDNAAREHQCLSSLEHWAKPSVARCCFRAFRKHASSQLMLLQTSGASRWLGAKTRISSCSQIGFPFSTPRPCTCHIRFLPHMHRRRQRHTEARSHSSSTTRSVFKKFSRQPRPPARTVREAIN